MLPPQLPNKPVVLQLGTVEHATRTWDYIQSKAHVITPKSTSRSRFLSECRSGALDGVQVIYRTFNSVEVTGPFDSELVNALPPSVRFICHNGAGYDQINIPACTAREIYVSNTPTAVDDSTADLAMYLILGCLRNLPIASHSLRAGQWRGNPPAQLGHDPQGKILGILGMGGIGSNIAAKARVFGMRVIYHNRKRLPLDKEDGAEYVDFDTLLRESDVISLNLPLNPQTRHTISHAEFALMKQNVIIINTARGAILDENALVHALNSGKVSSCGLDVFEYEPQIHPGLLGNEKVLLVPHMGTWSVETLTKMEEWAFENVRMAVEERKLKSIVPEQARWQHVSG